MNSSFSRQVMPKVDVVLVAKCPGRVSTNKTSSQHTPPRKKKKWLEHAGTWFLAPWKGKNIYKPPCFCVTSKWGVNKRHKNTRKINWTWNLSGVNALDAIPFKNLWRSVEQLDVEDLPLRADECSGNLGDLDCNQVKSFHAFIFTLFLSFSRTWLWGS